MSSNLILLYHFVTFIIGLLCAIVVLFTYANYKIEDIRSLAYFYLSYSVLVFSTMFNSVLVVIGLSPLSILEVIRHFSIVIMLYFCFRFAHQLFHIKHAKQRDTIIGGLCLIAGAEIMWKAVQSYLTHQPFEPMFSPIMLIVDICLILYSVYMLAKVDFSALSDFKKKGLRLFKLVTLLCTPLFIYDSMAPMFPSQPFFLSGFLVSDIYYAIISVLFTYGALSNLIKKKAWMFSTQNNPNRCYLFSYGTLLLDNVQREIFGHPLAGKKDSLVGYTIYDIPIEDQDVIKKSGKEIHPGLVLTGHDTDIIHGKVFDLTPGELELADAYEVDAYERVEVEMTSGVMAWVYAVKISYLLD